MYKWTNELSVGNKLIDEEHQHIFELLDRFYLGLKGQISKLDLLDLVKGLLEYANHHFSVEEAYMKKVGYPDIEMHMKLHRDFMIKAYDFYTKMESGKLLLTLEVTNFIKDWLVTHIKGEDVKIIRFVKSGSLIG